MKVRRSMSFQTRKVPGRAFVIRQGCAFVFGYCVILHCWIPACAGTLIVERWHCALDVKIQQSVFRRLLRVVGCRIGEES